MKVRALNKRRRRRNRSCLSHITVRGLTMVLCALSLFVLMRERSRSTAGAGAEGSTANAVAAELAASPVASAQPNTEAKSAMPSASLTELQVRLENLRIAVAKREREALEAAEATANAARIAAIQATQARRAADRGGLRGARGASAASAIAAATAGQAPTASKSKELQARIGGDVATAKHGTCEYQKDIDFADFPGGTDANLMKQGLSKEACCKWCSDLGRSICLVAVLSGPNDNPPSACWPKASANLPKTKKGVTACWPAESVAEQKAKNPGRALPTAPPPPPSQADADATYMKSLQKLTSKAAAQFIACPVAPSAQCGVLADKGAKTKDPAMKIQTARAAAVKGAVAHAWQGYVGVAWGRDNLSPISNRGQDGSFRHAVTMVDSLDTLWLAGLRTEWEKAVTWLSANLPGRINMLGSDVSVFETTIRSLGGLMGAHALSNDARLPPLIEQLGKKLFASMQPNGVSPYTLGGGYGGMGCPSLAESGTSQLEYAYLSQLTGNAMYSARARKFYDTVSGSPSIDGLWANCWRSGRGKITMGADGDSFYEYLLKAWLQTGRKDAKLWAMYNAAVDGMVKWLVHRGNDGLTYLSNFDWQGGQNGSPDHAMEHLSCFVPGWLALGAQFQVDKTRKTTHMKLAADLAYTCWQMYERQPTGIGPERVKAMKMDLSATDTREYILRPEAMEGWWYMWELTGDPKYREWGWKAFQAFEKHLKVQHGYASLRDVRSPRGGFLDRMESFWIAETLKYAYMLQDATHQVKLDEYVINTEAHPLPIKK